MFDSRVRRAQTISNTVGSDRAQLWRHRSSVEVCQESKLGRLEPGSQRRLQETEESEGGRLSRPQAAETMDAD
jgi:hypothetical protein